MKKFTIILSLLGVVLFIYILNFCISKFVEGIDTNSTFSKKIKESRDLTRQSSNKGSEGAAGEVKKRRVLVPDDPAKYGMTITPEEQMPQSSEEWEARLRATFAQNKILGNKEYKEVIEQMNNTPEEFAKNSAKLDEDIQELKDLLKEDPLNDQLNDMLQTNYKLKALTNILQEYVVKQGDNLDPKGIPPSVQAMKETQSATP